MKRSRLGWPDTLPILPAITYIGYGAYLLTVGRPETIVTPGGGSVTVDVPTSAGLLPLIAGGLVLYGIWSGRDQVAWAGGVFALAFGVAFLFSLAGVFISLAILLLAALTLRHVLARRQSAPSSGARRPTSTGSG